MSPLRTGAAVAALSVSLAFTALAAPASAATTAGYVYAATNDGGGNQIIVLARGDDGRLTTSGSFPTGGNGSGAPATTTGTTGTPGAGSGFEQSQNGLVLGGRPGAEVTSHADLLFAVNAGSNTVTVLRVNGSQLTPVGTPAPSDGTKPTSLTVHKDLLYVLNAGALPLGQGGVAPSISGLRIGADGSLTPIAGSKRLLSGASSAGAAQVSFDPTGKTVTVTQRNANALDTFLVQPDGTLSQPVTGTASGAAPFGFAQSVLHPGTLVVAQGNFPPPLKGAASSYRVNPTTGALSTLSGNVENQQSDSCWVVFDAGEKHAYISSFFSNAVSSYDVAADGTLTLNTAKAGDTAGTGGTGAQSGAGANDEATSADSRFLYVRNFFDGTIAAFAFNGDGKLTSLGNFGSVGPGTGFGLAAGPASQDGTPTPVVPEAPLAALLPLLAGGLVAVLVVRRRAVR